MKTSPQNEDIIVHRNAQMVLQHIDQLRIMGDPYQVLVVHELQLLLAQASPRKCEHFKRLLDILHLIYSHRQGSMAGKG